MSQLLVGSLVSLLQLLIGLGLINVWLVRSGRQTKYRGASAQNMKEEFAVYGLPVWFVYIIGFFKILIAIVMIVLLFVPHLMFVLGVPALILLSVLMLGAISMHIKVKDPLTKMLPAMGMLAMALVVLYIVHFVA